MTLLKELVILELNSRRAHGRLTMLHDRKWSNDAWNRWWHDEYGKKWAL